MLNVVKYTIRLFTILFAVSGYVAMAEQVEEPTGYKLDNYRSATPATLKDAIVVDVNQAKELFDSKRAVFIDVLPAPKRPDALTEDEVWLPPERLNIPGSVWLADVGYGVLSRELEDYFKSNLNELVQSNSDPLLFYCKANCWMSWNAAKRAIEYGYSNVFWFPGGTDDWSLQGFDLNQSKPIPN